MFGHYTSQRGLLRIIRHEILWATNIKFLNDEHEFQHALDLIREIIPTANIRPGMTEHEAFTAFTENLSSRLKSLDDYTSESIFTLSFSSEIDLLSQWRGYCTDNNGYCLVFDIDAIFEKAKTKYSDVYLLDCVYEKEDKIEKLRDLLNKYWLKYSKSTDEKQQEAVLDALEKEVMLLASHYKHPSFSEEKERRIVVFKDYFDTNRLQFREGRISLVPYIEIDASLKCLKMICIGPCSNKQLARRSLELFLEKMYGYPFGLNSDLAIKFSEAPYRS
jgi:hypothetical protein